MRTVRALSLAKETLTELTPDELASVAGGATTTAVSDIPCRVISQAFITCPTVDGCRV